MCFNFNDQIVAIGEKMYTDTYTIQNIHTIIQNQVFVSQYLMLYLIITKITSRDPFQFSSFGEDKLKAICLVGKSMSLNRQGKEYTVLLILNFCGTFHNLYRDP